MAKKPKIPPEWSENDVYARPPKPLSDFMTEDQIATMNADADRLKAEIAAERAAAAKAKKS